MHRNRPIGLLLCTLIAVGCGKDAPEEQASAPQKQVAALEQQHAVSRDIRTVRLHFDGFTKSKSGAT